MRGLGTGIKEFKDATKGTNDTQENKKTEETTKN